ncbi:MAG: TolC family protein [Bacteroidetes bacterium]|nr:MAG: TolC family protein [Bacteroidota bacterium]
MNILTRLIAVTLIFLAVLPLKAQSDTLYLTRESALEMALENNPSIAIARLEKARLEARVNEARGNLLPSLNATGSYTRNLKKQVIFFPEEMAPLFGGVTALEVGSDNSFMGGLQLALPLYNPAIYAGIDAARTEQKIAEENYRAQTIELTYILQRAWNDALLARESYEVIRFSFENARENLENIRKMHAQGLVAEYDLIRAEVQTENLRPDVLQAANAFDLSLSFLKTLLGVEEIIPVTIEGDLLESSEEMLRNFNITEAERALHSNPDYVNLGLQRDLILKQAKSVKATSLPSITAVSNYMYLTEANNFRFGDYNWVNTASAGLQLSIPIFRGLTNRNQVKQLEIGAKQIQLQREYLRNNLSIELSSILKSMDVALEKAVHARRNVELAQRGYDISRLRYESGQGTLLEVNDSDVSMTRARFNLLMAKHELLQAKAQYDRFIGQN